MPQAKRTIWDGLVLGVIGYASVAILYAAFDQFAARGALYTVDMLGKTVFRGLRDTSVLGLPIERDATGMLLYNGLHLAMSLAIGLVISGLIGYAERRPAQAKLVMFVIVSGFVVTIAGVGFLTSPIRPLLPWWSIVVANTLAVFTGGTYLVWRRPDTWRKLSPFTGETEVTG